MHSFLGNQTHKDHFKLLRSDGVNLLIGARNVVYNISLSDLKENREQVRKGGSGEGGQVFRWESAVSAN